MRYHETRLGLLKMYKEWLETKTPAELKNMLMDTFCKDNIEDSDCVRHFYAEKGIDVALKGKKK